MSGGGNCLKVTTSFALMKPGIMSFCLACSDDCRLRGAALPGSMCCGSKAGPLQAGKCSLSLSLCLSQSLGLSLCLAEFKWLWYFQDPALLVFASLIGSLLFSKQDQRPCLPAGEGVMLILVRSNLIAESCQVVPVIAGVVIHVSKGVGVLQGSRPKTDAPPFPASAVFGLAAACLLALGLPEVLSTLRASSSTILSCLKVSAAQLRLTALSLHCASYSCVLTSTRVLRPSTQVARAREGAQMRKLAVEKIAAATLQAPKLPLRMTEARSEPKH